MKITKIILFNILSITTWCYSESLSAKAILDSMSAVMQPKNAQGRMEQEIITSSGKVRVFEYEYYSANKGRDVMIRYIKPKKVRNNAFLVKNSGDDIWVYFPRTRRVRKLASHAKKQKAQGSDFSYEDFAGSEEWKRDYHVSSKLSPERKYYLLLFTPKMDVDTGYDSLHISVDKLSYYPQQIQYFKKGEHFKTLYLENLKAIQDITTAMTMRMKNHMEDSQTTMKILEMRYDVKFEEAFFTERNLKK